MKKIFIYLLFGLCFLFASSLIPYHYQELQSQESPGKLSKVHGKLEGEKNCIKCHTVKKEIAPSKCLGCHKELALRISAGKGYHKEKGEVVFGWFLGTGNIFDIIFRIIMTDQRVIEILG